MDEQKPIEGHIEKEVLNQIEDQTEDVIKNLTDGQVFC